MELFLQQALAGVATGGVYACIALALSMIYQAIRHVNFAQGEMAMVSTFIAWQLMQWTGAESGGALISLWLYAACFLAAIALSMIGGFAIQRLVFAPIRHAPVLSQIAVFVALFLIFNSLAGEIWRHSIKPFPSPFGSGPLIEGGAIGKHDAGMIAVVLALLALLYGFFRYTRVGLAMRAAAINPDSARLVGVRVERMAALGWAMASGIGAVAGMMIAHKVFLEPNMMLSILIYGFAGAVLGGLTSPGGAVLGGFLVGIVENLAATYVPVIGGELKLPIALALIVVVLVVKPTGLFGRKIVQRV